VAAGFTLIASGTDVAMLVAGARSLTVRS